MYKKNRLLLVCLAALFAAVPFGCGSRDAVPSVGENEIKLKIQLDLKEEIGLLLIDHSVNGTGGMGGMSNADKSMLRCDDVLYWDFDKTLYELDGTADSVDLTVRFTVVTAYFDPNYDNLYPKEFMVPMEALSFRAAFGNLYRITIRGDRTEGYRAVLESA